MSIKFLKNRKQLIGFFLIFSISSLAIFVLAAKNAEAGPIDKIAKAVTGALSSGFATLLDIGFETMIGLFLKIGVIFQTLFSIFFWFGAMLLEIAFGLEKFTDAGVVQMGWKITRDLTNLLFVLILLIIAMATILRIETYGMKQVLWKLIVVALLINFSLVLSGVIIDFAQVLTHYFYDQAAGSVGIASQISKFIKIQSVYEINKETGFGDRLGAGAGGVLMVVASIFLGIALIVCAGFALGIGAFFLIVRLIALWLLLIISPLAWLLWILPATSHLFRQWWSNFLKWTFFAPIYTFFVYLAIKAAEGGAFEGLIRTEVENIVEAAGFKETLAAVILSAPQLLLQFICIMGLLFGGLIVAQKMSIYGAQGAMSFAKGTGKRVARWSGKKGKMLTAPYVGELGEGLRKAGARMRARPGLKTLGRLTEQLARGPRAFSEQERAAFAGTEKKYDGWTSDNLKSQYRVVDPQAKAAIAKILAKRGHLKTDEKFGFTEKDVQDSVRLAKRYNQQGDVIKARPDLAPLVKKPEDTDEKAISDAIQSIKPADLDKLQPEAITPQVRQAIITELTRPGGTWGGSHLSKMPENNPKLFVKVKSDIINQYRGVFRGDVKNYLGSSPGQAAFGGSSAKPEGPPEEPPKEAPAYEAPL